MTYGPSFSIPNRIWNTPASIEVALTMTWAGSDEKAVDKMVPTSWETVRIFVEPLQ